MSISDSAINRRNFVAGAASTAALAAVAGLTGIAAADEPTDGASAPFETTVDWDAEYDVVVVGLGGAGCATAITAADLGSRVLVLEKACEGNSGGNSNVCMQFMGWTDDVPGMVEYMKWMRGGYETPSDEMIQLYVEEMAKNKEFFEYLGASDTTSFEMPEFPMCEYVDAFRPYTTNGYYGVRPGENFGGDGQTYALLKRNVVDRADLIDVWYEAPGDAPDPGPRHQDRPRCGGRGRRAGRQGPRQERRGPDLRRIREQRAHAAGLLRQHVLAVAGPRPVERGRRHPHGPRGGRAAVAHEQPRHHQRRVLRPRARRPPRWCS